MYSDKYSFDWFFDTFGHYSAFIEGLVVPFEIRVFYKTYYLLNKSFHK